MSPIITLFCEGKEESLDYRILQELNPIRSELKPVGGKSIFNAFIKGFFSSPQVAQKEYARAFRDRDFDYLIPDNPVLIEDGRFLISYRTTIENYLLDPQILFDYICAKGDTRLQSRLPSILDSENLFREICAELRFYNAARWAHGITKSNTVDKFIFKSSWPHNSGAVPAEIGDSDCRMILSDILDKVKNKARQLELDIFEEKYAEFTSKFTTEFVQDIDNCLIWFNAKDIASLIHRNLGGNSFFQNGQKDDYYDFAIENGYFSKSLENNEFPDLFQLQEILNGNMPIEPI